MKKLFRKIVFLAVLSCIVISSQTCMATQNCIPEEQSQCTETEATRRSMYLRGGNSTLIKGTNKITVKVTTEAFMCVEKLYHDVEIYKNDILYYSGRYRTWDNFELISSMDVPTQSGDLVEVYVDHYVEHNDYTETAYSEASKTY